MKSIEEIRELAHEAHAKTNHKYAEVYPYALHLNWVESVARRYIHLITDESLHWAVYATAQFHDTIEDARLNYSDVLAMTDNKEVAEAVFYLTNNRGRYRHDRADATYYKGVRENVIARYVKLCDRIANMEYGKIFGGKVDMYRKELEHFLNETGAYNYFPEMAAYLKTL